MLDRWTEIGRRIIAAAGAATASIDGILGSFDEVGGYVATTPTCGRKRPIRSTVAGRSSLVLRTIPEDVAQLVAHLLCKQGVEGSSPFVSTL